MFRMSGSRTGARTLIRIDGCLAGEYVRLAEQYCLEAVRSGKPVELLLRHVTAIDQAGQELLARLARQGVRLRGFGLYLSELLRRIRRSATGRQPASPSRRSSAGSARTETQSPAPRSKPPTGL